MPKCIYADLSDLPHGGGQSITCYVRRRNGQSLVMQPHIVPPNATESEIIRAARIHVGAFLLSLEYDFPSEGPVIELIKNLIRASEDKLMRDIQSTLTLTDQGKKKVVEIK